MVKARKARVVEAEEFIEAACCWAVFGHCAFGKVRRFACLDLHSFNREAEVPLPDAHRPIIASPQRIGQRGFVKAETAGIGGKEHRGNAGARWIAAGEQGGSRRRTYGIGRAEIGEAASR